MNADKVTLLLATLLLLLRSAEDEEMREGPAYAAMMHQCSLDEFQTILAVAETMGMVQRGSQFLVKITCKGRSLAYKLKQAMEPVS